MNSVQKSVHSYICYQLNDSFNGRFKVYRGKKEATDVGRVIEVDGNIETDGWFSDEENQFRGTDGYFIPPFRSNHEQIWAFERALCISMGLDYERKTHNRGLLLHKFTKNLNHFSENKAYCRENGACPIQGTLDLFNCIGAPIIGKFIWNMVSHKFIYQIYFINIATIYIYMAIANHILYGFLSFL